MTFSTMHAISTMTFFHENKDKNKKYIPKAYSKAATISHNKPWPVLIIYGKSLFRKARESADVTTPFLGLQNCR